jgi:hypothetical protein
MISLELDALSRCMVLATLGDGLFVGFDACWMDVGEGLVEGVGGATQIPMANHSPFSSSNDDARFLQLWDLSQLLEAGGEAPSIRQGEASMSQSHHVDELLLTARRVPP